MRDTWGKYLRLRSHGGRTLGNDQQQAPKIFRYLRPLGLHLDHHLLVSVASLISMPSSSCFVFGARTFSSGVAQWQSPHPP